MEQLTNIQRIIRDFLNLLRQKGKHDHLRRIGRQCRKDGQRPLDRRPVRHNGL